MLDRMLKEGNVTRSYSRREKHKTETYGVVISRTCPWQRTEEEEEEDNGNAHEMTRK